jgi:hypothetical protein
MWYSFHIYITDRTIFYENMQLLIEKWDLPKLFFIQYLDFTGFHYRVRISLNDKYVKKEVFNDLKNLFYGYLVSEKIYDPEYNTYGQYLEDYESYSTALSLFLIHHKIKKDELVYSLANAILSRFDYKGDDEFIKYYLSYWKRSLQYFDQSKNEFKNKRIGCEHTELASQLERLVEKHVKFEAVDETTRRKMCFQYLHMSLNKMGCLINEELTILLQLRDSWRELHAHR